MIDIPVLNFMHFVQDDGELFTTSDRVSVAFGELHGKVILYVQLLLSQLPPSYGHHFELLEVPESIGSQLVEGTNRTYRVSRFGFTLLAVLLAEKQNLGPTVAMLDAFDAVEAISQNQREGLKFADEESGKMQLRSGPSRSVLRRKLRRPAREIH